MAKNISDLLGKVENGGSTTAGKLSAEEWNTLVDAVIKVQAKAEGTIKGIKYNGGEEGGGQTFSEIDSDGYLKMTVADSSGYQLTVDITNPPAYIARGASCPIRINVSSKEISGNDYIPATKACSVNLYLNESPTAFYTGKVYDKDSTVPGAVKILDIDLSSIPGLALIPGEVDNEIKIEINNGFGTVKTSYCYVKVVDLSLSVDIFDVKNVFTENDKPQLIARVSGTDGYVTATVDGKEILKNGPALNGTDTNFGQDIFSSVNTHGVHTIEIVASVVRETAEGNITISSIPQKFNYIYGTTSTRPIVMSVLKNTNPEEYSNFEMSYVAYKYNSTAVAVTDTVKVALCNISDNSIVGSELITVSNDITFNPATNSGTGNVQFSLFPVDGTSLVGKKAIVISIGEFSQVTEIEVKKSSVTLSQLGGYAVYLTANNRSNDESSSTVKTWKSVGKDATGAVLNVEAIFDDNIEFINTGSGWIADSDGNMAMHLRKGRFFTLDYKPFETNPTYNDGTNNGTGRGKTISIEFATRNCLDQNSKVIECLDSSNGSERGFVITASNAEIKSNNFKLGAAFKEDTRIKIDFVIEGKKIPYTYNTISGKDATEFESGTSEEALCIIYVDGVYQGLKVIPASTTFLQGNSYNEPAKIRFGSNDCDLDIYNIRIYDQALTPAQIVSNYSYDTPNFNDKINIAKRNDIFEATSLGNKPNINIEKLRIARPALPFFYVQMELDSKTNDDKRLPSNKSDWFKLPFTEWKNPMNEKDKGEAAVSFTSTKGRWRNQGTSSMSYPWPWRNWDWQAKFDSDKGEVGFTFGDGTTGNKWSQYKGMSDAGSIKKITLKKDYASSEMCNNAITSEYFTDMALAIGENYPEVMSPAQRLAGAELTPFRLTFVATPCFLFQQFNNPTKEGTAGKGFEALGMMNLIPNKNECDHLGFSDKSGFTWESNHSQSWELADNMDDWFWYKKLNGIERNDDGTYTNDVAKCYEARYPKDSTLNDGVWDSGEESDFGMVVKDKPTITAAQRDALYVEQKDIIEFHNWLVDCNRQIPEDYYNGLVDEDGNLLPTEQQVFRGYYRELSGDEMAPSWNVDKDGNVNKYDTPDYRLKKFAAEAPTRMIIDQFCLYYIWRETFHAFDSGFKNLQIYTMGKADDSLDYMQWGCMVRDADTTLGIENTGKNIFPAHIEDIDYYEQDAQGNITFNYGGAKGLYHNKSIAARGGHAVLNGQLGSLWVNLRDTYTARIAELFRALSASSEANWTGKSATKRFRDHQEKWCESLYNFGMRQYFGGGQFTTWIESGLGDKKNSRASWLDRGFYYRNSKYNNLDDYCAGRIVCYYTPDFEEDGINHTETIPLKFKSYIPMYVGLGAHEQNMTSCNKFIRVTDIKNTYDVLPGSNGLDFAREEGDDTVTWFFGTDQLTEIGDLARCCKVKVWQNIKFPKLRELNLGHEKDRDGVEYREYVSKVEISGGEDSTGGTTEITKEIRPFTNQYLKSMNCSSLKQLTLLDVTNHTMLNQLDKLSECDQLQKLYARGTDALTNIELPATTSLDTIYLGKNLVTLNLTDLTGITNFVLEGADNLQQLYIRNCGPYMASRSYDIMNMAISKLEEVYDPKTNNNICILSGIDWKNATVQDIERLYNINAQLSGRIELLPNQTLTNELKVNLVSKYGNIDDINNGLYMVYTQTPITNVSMPNKIYIHKEGDTQLTFTVNRGNPANTYSYAEWSLSTNSYATINTATGVITRNSTVANENTPSAKLKVKVYQIPDKNGKERPVVESNEVSVFFYERIAKPGDIVFNDGTYSDELDPAKTPIGVCFYVDPTDRKNKRLMCSLEPLEFSRNASINFGCTVGGGMGGNGGNLVSQYYGSPRTLGIDNEPGYNCFDINTIDNLLTRGASGDNTTIYYVDSVYRDRNNTNNDTFKSYEKDTYYGSIGWFNAEKNVEVDNLTIPYSNETEISINAGDNVPIGYFNTLAIIQHRNKLLDEYNRQDPDNFIRPYSDGNKNELSRLGTFMTNADSAEYEGRSPSYVTGNNKSTLGSLLYYPAASACFAYEPNASNLDDKFKKYNWFLPAAGDMVRILYYCYQSYGKGVNDEPVNSTFGPGTSNPANAFSNVMTLSLDGTNVKVLQTNGLYGSTSYTLCTSSEAGQDDCISVSSQNGYANSASKSSSYRVRPICVF
jgi:hypothetical protein